MSLRRAARRVAPAAVPFVLAVALLGPATLGGKVLSSSDIPLFAAPFPAQPPGARPASGSQPDAAYVFEPDGLVVRDALRHGRLPVWTPYQSAGQPLLASQQSAPLFPLNWIADVFPYFDSLAWIAVLKLTLAALGAFVLARELGLRRGAALLGGLAFGFGTYLVAWLSHPHANAYVVLPWLFLLAARTCRTGRVVDAAALGGVLGVAWLGGQPESGLIVSLAALAWTVHRLLAARLPRRAALRRAGLAAGGAVLGLALAAVMLVPLAEALHQSYATSRANPALGIRSVLTLFFPRFWPDANGSFGPANFLERTLYVGAMPTMLAVAGLVARRPRGSQLFFAGLALVALIVSLDVGFLTSLVRDLPLLDQVNLNRVLVLAAFAIAMLAAYGCDRLAGAAPAERRRMLVALAATGLVPALGVLAAHPSWLDHVSDGVRRALGRDTQLTGAIYGLGAVLRWLGFAVAGAAVLAAAPRLWRRRAETVVVAAIALSAVDLLAMGRRLNPAIDEAHASPPAPPAVRVMRALTAGGGRVVGIHGMQPNTASRWGLEDARGHEDPRVEREHRLWFALGGTIETAAVGVAPGDPRTPKLLDVLGVRAVLFDPSVLPRGRAVLPPAFRGYRIAYAGPGGVVAVNPSALPRAFVAYGWRRSPGLKASLAATAAGTAQQARDEPVVETPQTPSAGPAMPATPARLVSRTDTAVTLDVQARAPGQLVLLDTYYPGWRAEVDGHRTPIRPADAAFRSVAVGAGRHRVRFIYRPASVVAGGAISLAALAGLVACLLIGWRRRAPRSVGE